MVAFCAADASAATWLTHTPLASFVAQLVCIAGPSLLERRASAGHPGHPSDSADTMCTHTHFPQIRQMAPPVPPDKTACVFGNKVDSIDGSLLVHSLVTFNLGHLMNSAGATGSAYVITNGNAHASSVCHCSVQERV